MFSLFWTKNKVASSVPTATTAINTATASSPSGTAGEKSIGVKRDSSQTVEVEQSLADKYLRSIAPKIKLTATLMVVSCFFDFLWMACSFFIANHAVGDGPGIFTVCVLGFVLFSLLESSVQITALYVLIRQKHDDEGDEE